MKSMIQRAKMGTNGIFLGTKGLDRNITFCFIVRKANNSFFRQLQHHSHTTLIFPVWLCVSDDPLLSLFLHRVNSPSFRSYCSVLKAQWIDEAVAVKVVHLSQLSIQPPTPRSPSNAFTRISLIYKAYAHLQTHSPHPFKSNAEQWRQARLESGEEESGVA